MQIRPWKALLAGNADVMPATRAVGPGPAELCRKHRTCVKSLKVLNGRQLRIKAERSAPAPPRPAHETYLALLLGLHGSFPCKYM